MILFSKISNGFFFTSDEGSDFKKLKYYDLDKDLVAIELTKHIDWEVTYLLHFTPISRRMTPVSCLTYFDVFDRVVS